MKNRIVEVVGYPFVSHVEQDKRPKCTFDLNQLYGGGYVGCIYDLRQSGNIKRMGYLYNLKPHLKKYLYKQYDSWTEVYAPNKTLLRSSIYGRIDKIVEIKD